MLHAVVHLVQLDLLLVFSALSAALCLTLQAILLLRPAWIGPVLHATVPLLALSSLYWMPTGHSALMPVAQTIFTVYALIPFPLLYSALVCTFLSLLQLLVFTFTAIPFTITQVNLFKLHAPFSHNLLLPLPFIEVCKCFQVHIFYIELNDKFLKGKKLSVFDIRIYFLFSLFFLLNRAC